MRLTPQQPDHYKEQDFVVIPHLFSKATVKLMREHYMKRSAEGPKPGDTVRASRRNTRLTCKKIV